MRNWNSSIVQTLIHFGLQTLKINEQGPFNLMVLVFLSLLNSVSG